METTNNNAAPAQDPGKTVALLSYITLIGLITFVLSTAGVVIGNRFGMKYKNKAELAGGFVLIFIGLKILLDHLGIL